MNQIESQEKKVLKHLQEGKTITHLECERLFNCTRLSDRIFCLRNKGYNIKTTRVPNLRNRGYHAVYSLVK